MTLKHEYVPKSACVEKGMHQSNSAVIQKQRRHFTATGFIDFPRKTPYCMQIWLYVIKIYKGFPYSETIQSLNFSPLEKQKF